MRNTSTSYPPRSEQSLADAPCQIRNQLDHLTQNLCEILHPNLIGIYLHGSLAMGCFNPETSDIDLLAITVHAPDDEARRALLAALLAASGRPRPVEISFVRYAQIRPWHYPTPYDLHFSEMHRAAVALLLAGATTTDTLAGTDIDLAAHFTVLAQRGLCLHGKAIDVLGIDVPWTDYLDALRSDMAWAEQEGNGSSVYRVLNACRCWAAVEEDRVLSKAEGGRWAIGRVMQRHRGVIRAAAARYAGTECELKPAEVDDYCAWVRNRLGW